MKTPLILKVATRAQTGRSASRRLRKVNRIPAILYGKHSAPEKLSIEVPEFTKLLKSVAGRSLLIELNRDPITDRYLHVDLHEVKPDETFEIRVPVRVTGESFGVKNQSGVLEIASHMLRVRCLPSDLPEAIEIDVTPLKVGETVKVGELKPVSGVTFLDDKGQPVVACVEPVAEVVVETVAAAPVEGAEAAPAADGAAAAPAADGKAAPGDGKAAPAGDKKAAAPAAGDKKPAAPAAGAKPAGAAKAAAPAKK